MQGCRSGDQYSCTRLARRSAAGAPAGRSWRRPGPADPAHRRGQFAGVFVGLGGLCPRGGIVVDGAGDVPDISQHVRRPHAACDRLRGRQRQDGLEASLRPRQPLFAELARFALCQQVVHRAGGIRSARLPGRQRRRRRPRRRLPARASCGWRCAESCPVLDRRLPVCMPAAADSTDRYRGPAARRWLASAAPPRSGTSWTAWRAACRRGRPAVAREVGAAGNDHAGADEAGKQERLCEFLRVGHGGWSVRVHSVSSRCCVGRRRAAGLPARDAGRCLVRRVPACSR